jgi:hypothetical protein
VAAAILDREPEPVTAVQPLTPPAFEHVVTTCLAKDPEARWQAASDVAREMRWIADERRLGRTPASGSAMITAAAAVPGATRRRRLWRIVGSISAALALVVATAGLTWVLTNWFKSPGHALHLSIGPHPAERFQESGLIGGLRACE